MTTLLLLAGLGDVWHWIVHVVERMGNISPYWLVLALALKTGALEPRPAVAAAPAGDGPDMGFRAG